MKRDFFGTAVGLFMLAGAYGAGKAHGKKEAFNDVKTVLLESIVDAATKKTKEAKES